MALRDQILSANDSPLERLSVPEWGCDVFLKPLSGHARAKLVKLAHGGASLYGPALVASVCDESGKLAFTDDDVPALEERNGLVLERLAAHVVKLNGLSGDAVESAKNG